MQRGAERGSAVFLTLIMLTALLAGGAVFVGMQMQSTQSMGLVKENITAMNCAESGLSAARNAVEANRAGWTAALCNPVPPRGTGTCVIGSPASEPVWLQAPGIPHDLDGDGSPDFVLTLVDNDDETPTDPATNSDQEVQIVSTCIKYPDNRAQVTEQVRYDLATHKLVRTMWFQTE